jgi:hypothetical protein
VKYFFVAADDVIRVLTPPEMEEEPVAEPSPQKLPTGSK